MVPVFSLSILSPPLREPYLENLFPTSPALFLSHLSPPEFDAAVVSFPCFRFYTCHVSLGRSVYCIFLFHISICSQTLEEARRNRLLQLKYFICLRVVWYNTTPHGVVTTY